MRGGTGSAYTTFAGPTVARTYTLPDANATLARTDAAQTFSGIHTFLSPIAGSISGTAAGLASTLGYAGGGTNATSQTAAINNMHPTPTRAGDILYWNGTAWTTLAGNNSGTQFLQENASGVPSWVTVSGTGTVTSVTCFGTAITTSGTCVTGGQMPGEPSNGSASAGNVGEFVNASVLSGAPVSLTTGIAANVTSISLTAGDWDVNGTVNTSPGASTTTSYAGGAITTVSATWPGLGGTGTGAAGASAWSSGVNTVAGNPAPSAVVPTTRISLSATTTIYLVAISNFAASTNGAYGFIRARRVR